MCAEGVPSCMALVVHFGAYHTCVSFLLPPQLGLPTGKHVFLYASVNGNTVMRAYTPTSSQEVGVQAR